MTQVQTKYDIDDKLMFIREQLDTVEDTPDQVSLDDIHTALDVAYQELMIVYHNPNS